MWSDYFREDPRRKDAVAAAYFGGNFEKLKAVDPQYERHLDEWTDESTRAAIEAAGRGAPTR
jgi:hypothetical protein